MAGHPGGQGDLPFVLKVDSRGLYLLSFEASLTRREESVALRSMPGYVPPQQVWGSKSYLTVQ